VLAVLETLFVRFDRRCMLGSHVFNSFGNR
jgi:hypothetical protein